jgi:hypothetical protein
LYYLLGERLVPAAINARRLSPTAGDLKSVDEAHIGSRVCGVKAQRRTESALSQARVLRYAPEAAAEVMTGAVRMTVSEINAWNEAHKQGTGPGQTAGAAAAWRPGRVSKAKLSLF